MVTIVAILTLLSRFFSSGRFIQFPEFARVVELIESEFLVRPFGKGEAVPVVTLFVVALLDERPRTFKVSRVAAIEQFLHHFSQVQRPSLDLGDLGSKPLDCEVIEAISRYDTVTITGRITGRVQLKDAYG